MQHFYKIDYFIKKYGTGVKDLCVDALYFYENRLKPIIEVKGQPWNYQQKAEYLRDILGHVEK